MQDGLKGRNSGPVAHGLAALIQIEQGLAPHVLREMQPALASPQLDLCSYVNLLTCIMVVQASNGTSIYSATDRVIHPFVGMLEQRPDSWSDINAHTYALLSGTSIGACVCDKSCRLPTVYVSRSLLLLCHLQLDLQLSTLASGFVRFEPSLNTACEQLMVLRFLSGRACIQPL